MKKILDVVNRVMILLLIAGVVVLFGESQIVQKEIKHLKGEIDAIAKKQIQNSTGSDNLKRELSELPKEDSSKEEMIQALIRAEGKIKTLSEEVSKAKEKLDKLPEVSKEDPDNVPVTRAEVKNLLKEEFKKIWEERRAMWEKKKVTLDELATELNLTYEEKTKMQDIITGVEKQMVQIIFDIKDEAQMTEFKAKLVELQYNPEVKKELQNKITTRIFSEGSKFMPILMDARNKIWDCLGEEKATKYETNNYEIDTQSELSPAIKLINETFGPARQRRSKE